MSKLRFSLAALLVVVTALSIWLARTSNEARDQEAGLAGVESNEGIVQFNTKLDVPEWLRNAVGEEYFRDEKTVSFATGNGRKRHTQEPKATDATLRLLESLNSIEGLELGNNNEVTDSGLVHLKSLRNLRTVYLQETGIRGPGLVHLVNLHHPTSDEINARLKHLEIDGVVETDATKPGSPIVGFQLFDSTLSDNVVLHLINHMPDLEVLILNRGLVGDDLLEGVARLNLRHLTLTATRITDDGLQYLSLPPNLEELVLSETGITDAGLAHLHNLSHVRSIVLDSTRVTTDGIERLKQLCQTAPSFGSTNIRILKRC